MKVTVVETPVAHSQLLKNNWKLIAAFSGVGIAVSAGVLYWRYGRRSSSDKPDRKTIQSSVGKQQKDEEHDIEMSLEQQPMLESVEVANAEAQAEVAVNVKELALELKDSGNKLFASNLYEEAIEKYTKALDLYQVKEKDCGVLYGNRAACYHAMKQYDNALEDCNKAIECDARYLKAYMRRALVYEKKEDYVESLHDYTTACALEKFSNSSIIDSADRVLRKAASGKAKSMFNCEAVKQRTELPSSSFISAFMSSFSYKYVTAKQLISFSKDALNDAEKSLVTCIIAFQDQNWQQSFNCALKAYESKSDLRQTFFLALVANVLGTYRFLIGQTEDAAQLLSDSLSLSANMLEIHWKDLHVNTMIKIASLKIESGPDQDSVKACMEVFDQANIIDSKNPDIYYHRGQICLLMQEYGAAKDYYMQALQYYEPLPANVIDLKFTPALILARIQKAVLEYREQHVQKANKLFENLEKEFPWCSDVYFHHGEMLLESQDNVDKALECFQKASDLNANSPMPYLNEAIIHSHVKNDLVKAAEVTRQALAIDPKSDMGWMHLAQVSLGQGDFSAAVQYYQKAVELSRSAVDAENSLMGLEAAIAQKVAVSRVGTL